MTDHEAVDRIYENDEAMAKLGREMIDKVLGLRKQGFSDIKVGTLLLLCVDGYIDEAAEKVAEQEPT